MGAGGGGAAAGVVGFALGAATAFFAALGVVTLVFVSVLDEASRLGNVRRKRASWLSRIRSSAFVSGIP